MEETLGSRLAAFEDVMGRGGEVADRISRDVGTLTETISGRFEEMDRLITVQGRTMAESFSERAREATGAIETQLTALEEHATRRTSEITGNFDTIVDRVDTVLGARSTALNEALVVRTGEMARVMAEGGRDMASALRPASTKSARQWPPEPAPWPTRCPEGRRDQPRPGDRRTRSARPARQPGGRDQRNARQAGPRKSPAFSVAVPPRSPKRSATAPTRSPALSAARLPDQQDARKPRRGDRRTLDERVSMFEERVVNRLDGVVEAIDERGHRRFWARSAAASARSAASSIPGAVARSSLGERGEAIGRDVAAISDITLRTLESAATRDRHLQDRSFPALRVSRSATLARLTSSYMQSTEAMRVAIDEGTARAVETLIGTNERLRGE